jgi:hypothetical protein
MVSVESVCVHEMLPAAFALLYRKRMGRGLLCQASSPAAASVHERTNRQAFAARE